MFNSASDFDIGMMRNTKSMSLYPMPPDKFNELDPLAESGGELALVPIMTGELFRQTVAFPIIVEAWDKKAAGRCKRKWEELFTQAERNKISKYYGRFYRWYLVTGVPARVTCSLATIHLLQRAVDFFATL